MPVSQGLIEAVCDVRPVSQGGPGFGVYIHWPFCAAKCPYCDFNSHVRHEPVDQQRYVRAYLAELDHFAARSPGRVVDSIFFGGGTPSLMLPETVAALIDGVRARWALVPDAEITLEANPTSVEARRFAGYAAAGVNRLSMGLQSLDDAALKKLGRMHTVAEARAAFAIARDYFQRVSFDLIYARPGQSAGEWKAELGQALALAADHLSLYQLTIEPGTAFFDLHKAGRIAMPGDDHARDLYDLTQDMCTAAGLEAYEVSNHAAPGAQCRHNLVYWRYGDYAGIGPGAHGRVGQGGERRATSTQRNPERWCALVEQQGHGLVADEALNGQDQASEMLLMGLRLTEGIAVARYELLAGHGLCAPALEQLLDDGLVETVAPDRLRVTREGRPVLNAVIAALAG